MLTPAQANDYCNNYFTYLILLTRKPNTNKNNDKLGWK